MASERIVQLVQAQPGFYVQYTGVDGDRDTVTPIACWALLENERGEQRVVGVDVVGEGDPWTPDMVASNLTEYVHSHIPLDTDGNPLTTGQHSRE